MRLSLICSAFAVLFGCAGLKGPPSPIVEKAEACGAGDLSRTSFVAMQDWFAKHRDCAVAVDGMCRPVRESATAEWADSTEGLVCSAARGVAQWVKKPANDHQSFQSGWK